jgi:hypothetical protein
MSDRVILTEKREQLLTGRYEGKDVARRNQKSRLRKSAQTAIQELTMIARSPHIDNTEVFDADDMGQLLEAILRPDQQHLEPGEADPDDFTMFVSPEKYTDEFENHHNAHLARLGRIVAREQVFQAENEPESSEN